jgi:hypothetical protein
MSDTSRFSFHLRPAQRALLVALLVGATVLVAHARARDAAPPPRDPAASGGVAPAPVAARIEVAFVLDTTGSMSGLIEGAKREIWSIASRLAAGQPKELRVALVGYRDRGDAYVTQVHDLSADLDTVWARLRAFEAGGGGDGPESVNQALHEAVTQLAWSRDPAVYRVIFLVGDAPPHLDYQDDVPYAESVRLARARDIAVNTVQCGTWGETAAIWREIAALGAGQYAAIAQDGAFAAIETPHDAELARLGRELAATALPYGPAEAREEVAAQVAGSVAAPAPAAAERLAYLAKNAAGRLNTGARDLLDALGAGVALDAVPERDLPEPVRAMPRAARKDFVEKKLAERRALQERVRQLAEKREAWADAERARRAGEDADAGFDAQVLGAVRAQAAAKGIVVE